MNMKDIMQNKSMRMTTYLKNSLVSSVVLTSLGCEPVAPPTVTPGTPAQAIIARASMHEGNEFVQDLGMELADVVNRFQPVHPATQAFIIEPPILPVPIVTEASIIGWFGTHTETTPGSFSTAPSSTRGISIELLNGIDIEFIFDTETMGPSVGVTGILDNFRLRITSDNRDIETPREEKVGIELDYDVLAVNQAAQGVLPAGMDTDGYIGFTRQGPLGLVDVIYDVKRTLGSGGNTAGATVNDGQFLRFRDITQGAGAKQWQSVNQLTYTNPVEGGPWVGKSASQIYSDEAVQYSGLLTAKSMSDYTSSGIIEYIASGEITLQTPAGPVNVGKLSGGPYSCDLTNPANPLGSGTNIVMEWNDGTSEILMPTSQFSCARVIAQ